MQKDSTQGCLRNESWRAAGFTPSVNSFSILIAREKQFKFKTTGVNPSVFSRSPFNRPLRPRDAPTAPQIRVG